MKVRVIDKPCLFAETVYLLYYYINGIAYTRDYERVNRKFGRYLLENEDQGLQLAQELDRISAAVTQTARAICQHPFRKKLVYFAGICRIKIGRSCYCHKALPCRS